MGITDISTSLIFVVSKIFIYYLFADFDGKKLNVHVFTKCLLQKTKIICGFIRMESKILNVNSPQSSMM